MNLQLCIVAVHSCVEVVCPIKHLHIFSLTAVDCGTLTNPSNGEVNHTAGTTFGSNAIYSCYAEYFLLGNSTRTCQAAGNWSESVPICQRMLLLSI